MEFLDMLREEAAQSGFFESGYIATGRLRYHPEVRRDCEKNSCRNYCATWGCPPAIGTVEECKARVDRYDGMLLFSGKYALEDSFDFEGMVEGLMEFKKCIDRFQDRIRDRLEDFALLSNEGCGRCESCTYPDAPCRFPKLLHHSLTGYGFVVSELAKEAGLRYNNGQDTVTYFGALLFRLPQA